VAVVAFHAQDDGNSFAANMKRDRDLHMYHLLSEGNTPTAFRANPDDIARLL
jgi:hypothetical protein